MKKSVGVYFLSLITILILCQGFLPVLASPRKPDYCFAQKYSAGEVYENPDKAKEFLTVVSHYEKKYFFHNAKLLPDLN
ncbi:MAG: hypothetical protein ACLFQV_07940 [Vulcanimicrobiota bacterium]